MNPEEKDELWELLGKARRQEPGSFFARNTARQARILGTRAQEPQSSLLGKVLDWFQGNPVALPATAVAVAAFGLFLNLSPSSSSSPLVATPEATVAPEVELAPDSEEIVEFAEELSELDEINQLVALQDVSAIDDDAIALLLF